MSKTMIIFEDVENEEFECTLRFEGKVNPQSGATQVAFEVFQGAAEKYFKDGKEKIKQEVEKVKNSFNQSAQQSITEGVVKND